MLKCYNSLNMNVKEKNKEYPFDFHRTNTGW